MIKKILIALIKAYQKIFSPLMAKNCRFYPTCSDYMLISIEKKGAVKGFWAGLRRLSRCHPWSPGGVDLP